MELNDFIFKLKKMCEENKELFSYPKIYINDVDKRIYYNSLNSICFSYGDLNRKGSFYNNNKLLKEIISLKKECTIPSDLYLEFNGNKLSFMMTPIYNSIGGNYFNELKTDIFTLKMIKKISNEENSVVRISSMVDYLKLFDMPRSFLIIQYLCFYKLISGKELSRIYCLYISYLNKFFSFSINNSERLIGKALFEQFSIKEVNLE